MAAVIGPLAQGEELMMSIISCLVAARSLSSISLGLLICLNASCCTFLSASDCSSLLHLSAISLACPISIGPFSRALLMGLYAQGVLFIIYARLSFVAMEYANWKVLTSYFPETIKIPQTTIIKAITTKKFCLISMLCLLIKHLLICEFKTKK